MIITLLGLLLGCTGVLLAYTLRDNERLREQLKAETHLYAHNYDLYRQLNSDLMRERDTIAAGLKAASSECANLRGQLMTKNDQMRMQSNQVVNLQKEIARMRGSKR